MISVYDVWRPLPDSHVLASIFNLCAVADHCDLPPMYLEGIYIVSDITKCGRLYVHLIFITIEVH